MSGRPEGKRTDGRVPDRIPTPTPETVTVPTESRVRRLPLSSTGPVPSEETKSVRPDTLSEAPVFVFSPTLFGPPGALT